MKKTSTPLAYIAPPTDPMTERLRQLPGRRYQRVQPIEVVAYQLASNEEIDLFLSYHSQEQRQRVQVGDYIEYRVGGMPPGAVVSVRHIPREEFEAKYSLIEGEA